MRLAKLAAVLVFAGCTQPKTQSPSGAAPQPAGPVAAVIAPSTSPAQPGAPLIYAKRGYGIDDNDEMEKSGFLTLSVAADGTAIVFHDGTLSETRGGKELARLKLPEAEVTAMLRKLTGDLQFMTINKSQIRAEAARMWDDYLSTCKCEVSNAGEEGHLLMAVTDGGKTNKAIWTNNLTLPEGKVIAAKDRLDKVQDAIQAIRDDIVERGEGPLKTAYVAANAAVKKEKPTAAPFTSVTQCQYYDVANEAETILCVREEDPTKPTYLRAYVRLTDGKPNGTIDVELE